MGRKYAQVRSLAARVDMRTMRLCQWDIFEGLQSAGPRTSLLVAALFHEHVCQGFSDGVESRESVKVHSGGG